MSTNKGNKNSGGNQKNVIHGQGPGMEKANVTTIPVDSYTVEKKHSDLKMVFRTNKSIQKS